MPAGVADFGSEQWLQMLFGVITVPDQYYLALCSDEPGPSMDGDILADLEPTDPAYHRTAYGVGEQYWATDTGFITNLDDVDFGYGNTDWGDINHFALVSAPSGGGLYAWGEFLNPQYVTADSGLTVPAGGLVVTLTSLDNSIAV